jgi:alanyl-tRNA synthetase
MTTRLYYTDPYCREFDAVVDRVTESGGKPAVTLDRTCFYPTSGGQPFDVGTLSGRAVVDTIDEEDGTITHVLDPAAGPLRSGEPVHGAIDWARRFDHMQQHTGQHMLSAAFDRLFGVGTVSFHLGADGSTIDLAREVSLRELTSAEDEANRVVWEDRPVTIRFVDEEEAARLKLRKPPKRGGKLRLIDVEDFDLSACGGTHVARTGAVGTIAIGSWERFKGGSRIEFLCGGRALARFRSLRDTVAASMRVLSVGAGEIASGIERLQGEMKDQKRAMTAITTELARYRAEEIATEGEPFAGGRLVARSLDFDANGLKTLASAITAKPGFVVVLASTASPALVVVARSSDVGVAANDVLGKLTAKFGGRGGGKPEMAQGGGLNGAPDDVVAYARGLITASA